MNIKVTTTKVEIDNESLNKGEYNIRECNFELAEEFTGLVCKALFTISKTKLTYEQSIVNGKCNIPYEATLNRGKVIIGVIGYEIEDEELIKRYSPEPDEFFVLNGSYIEDIENQSTPTPSELEQLEQRVSAIEIDAEQVEINTQDISDIKQEQITQNNDILLRSLITETGSQIELNLNSTNFKMTATLKDKNGNVVNTSNEIDLPLESVVVNASYDSTTKELVLTLQNGTTVRVSIADLVSGLVSYTDYANTSRGGTIRVSSNVASAVDSGGILYGQSKEYNAYLTGANTMFISKGTLENVITGKELVNQTQLNTKADKSSLVTGTGENITLQNTAELEFIQPPLPGGNSEQVQYSGKQLLPFTNQDVTLGGVTFKAINGRLILNGTATENINGSYFINNYFKVHLTQGNYILSRTNVNSNLTIMFLSSNVDVIGRLSRDSSDLTNSFTISAENDYYIGFYISSGVSFNNYDSGVMVSTTGGAYEPYVGGTASPNPSYSQEITNVTGDVEVKIQNKNLALNDDPENPDANYVSSGNGSTVVQYSTTEKGYYTTVHRRRNFGLLKAGNYTISCKAKARSDGGSSSYCILVYKGTGIINNLPSKSSLTNSYQTFSLTFTLTEDTEVYCVFYNTLYWKDIQIEYNPTATTYTPHQEQTYTFPLGTQRMYLGDYLADDGIHHVRKQIVFNGSENLQARSDASTDDYLVVRQGDYVKGTDKALNYSDYFKVVTSVSYNTNNIRLVDSNGYGIHFTISKSIASTVDEFKTWLSTHNVTVELEPSQEEITPYTTEQQTAYDEIKQAISYEEQTNISGSSDESNPLFEVQAVQYKEPDYWTIAYVNTQIGNAIGGAY